MPPGAGFSRSRIRSCPAEAYITGAITQQMRILAVPIMLAHLAIAGLDVGRFHWSDRVPLWVRIVAFGGLIACLSIWALAMHHNKFFSSVIRIQRDRGHRLVDTGPYRIVRHPGYASALTTYLWSALALGSWWSLVPGAFMTVLFFRRIVLEDRTLQEQLEGYRDYAARVRYRVLPGVW